jgi:hypothetical protein
MNTHDVSSTPQYMQLLHKQKQTLRDAESHKGQRPRERKSRDQITQQFMFRLMMNRSKANRNTLNIRSSFIPSAYWPCLNSLADLTKVKINDLLLETHHRGNYLVLRSITPPDRMNAIAAIVEDEDKDAIMLQIYHEEEENERAAEDIFGEGVVLIVKEPYLRLMADGDYGLRVDHLSDVIYLPHFDERIPGCWQPRVVEYNLSASAWKMKGNNHFYESKYDIAIEE